MDLHEHSALELRDLLLSAAITPTELTEHYLARIADSRPGAFVTVTPALALARAAALEAVGPGAPLWGLPHADKDLAHRPGVPTYFGSAAVKARVDADPDALDGLPTDPIVELADAAGLISLGKTNTPEFGLYGYTESLVAPPARHPLDTSLGAGGSSGGAAVAVASGLLPFAIGSDGGGSVRIPAATVGLIGLKPTLGAVTVDNTAPEAGGVVNGPLARSAIDAALLFEAMSGAEADSLVRRVPYAPESVRIGWAVDSPWNPTYDLEPDPALAGVLQDSLAILHDLGHRIGSEISLADPDYGAVFLRSWQLAASHIPPFFDASLFGPVTRWLLEAGRSYSAEEALQNLADKQAFSVRCAESLREADVLITPALGQLPRPIGWYSDRPETNFEQQCAYSPYTSFVNVLGWPAITVPMGTADGKAALPLGIQLIGRPGSDLLLLQLAHQLERASGRP